MKHLFVFLLCALAPFSNVVAAIYSTQGERNAGNIALSFEYPDDWIKLENAAPGQIAAFIKTDNSTYSLGAIISVTTIEPQLQSTIKDFFTRGDFPKECASFLNAEIISAEPFTTREGLSAWKMILKRKVGFGDGAFGLNTSILFENAIVEIGCYTASLRSTMSSEEFFKKNEVTFQRLLDTVKIDTRHKPISETNIPVEAFLHQSDYAEFSANNVDTFSYTSPTINLSFKYPKTWIAVDSNAIPAIPHAEVVKMFLSSRNKGVGLNGFAVYRWKGAQAKKYFEECVEDLTSKNLKKVFPSIQDLRYIYANGKKGFVFTTRSKTQTGTLTMRIATFPTEQEPVSVAYILMSNAGQIEQEREFDQNVPLHNAIIETLKISPSAFLPYTQELASSLSERKRYAEEQEALSSLKSGERPAFSIPRHCSFEVPEGMEAKNNLEKADTQKLHQLLNVPETGVQLIFQQKGLSKFSKEALDEYCRLFVYINENSPEESFAITEPLPISEEELDDLHQFFKTSLEAETNKNASAVGAFKISAIKKPRIKRINGYDCLYIEYVRQLNSNPPMQICSYTFFNFDREIRFSANYRVKDREKWAPRIEGFLKSLKFHDRSDVGRDIPKNAKCISGIKEGEHILLPVKVSGNIGELKTYLLFDSGATITTLPKSIVKSVSTKAYTRNCTLETMAGADLFSICELNISVGETSKDIDVAVGEKIDTGVLGLNFFEGFRYLVDMPNAKIYYWELNSNTR